MTLLVLGAGGGALFFIGLYLLGSQAVIYIGFVAMLAASMTDLVRRLLKWRELGLKNFEKTLSS